MATLESERITNMAEFSFAGVSYEIKRELRKESRVMETVLDELCAHADAYGMAYPGHRRLADKSCYAEESVKVALNKLGDMDLFRCHLTSDGVRAKPFLTYQLNPHKVLYVREQLFDEVVKLWNKAKPYSVIRSLTEYVQPEQPEYQPESQPDLQPESQPQNPLKKGANGKSKTRQLTNGTDKKSNGKAVTQTANIWQFDTTANGVTHGETEDKIQNPPPLRVPPPFSSVLANIDEELLAQDLRTIGGGTKLERAREIVWTYGVPLVKKAMAESGGKRNRIGWIVSALGKGWVKYNPKEDCDDWRMYLVDREGNFNDPEHENDPEYVAWRDSVFNRGVYSK
jgi:hypothetical protein